MESVVLGATGASTVGVAGLAQAASVNAMAINTTKTKRKIFMLFSWIFLLQKRF
jgi:hypothetical protein